MNGRFLCLCTRWLPYCLVRGRVGWSKTQPLAQSFKTKIIISC
uniref:Uncharacterized protein n=1 Tax=Anguilla anguilla TaxID=7936 RepID=A0A0E9QBD6_ANGAN